MAKIAILSQSNTKNGDMGDGRETCYGKFTALTFFHENGQYNFDACIHGQKGALKEHFWSKRSTKEYLFSKFLKRSIKVEKEYLWEA